MRETKSNCYDPIVLRSRITVNDRELPYLLGMGAAGARKFAEECNAIIFIGERKIYSVEKLLKGARDLSF